MVKNSKSAIFMPATVMPLVEKTLRLKYGLNRTEGLVLLILSYWQGHCLRVKSNYITKTKIAHPRNLNLAIVKLKNEGFIESKRIKGMKPMVLFLTEKGEAFIYDYKIEFRKAERCINKSINLQ